MSRVYKKNDLFVGDYIITPLNELREVMRLGEDFFVTDEGTMRTLYERVAKRAVQDDRIELERILPMSTRLMTDSMLVAIEESLGSGGDVFDNMPIFDKVESSIKHNPFKNKRERFKNILFK